MPDAPDTPTLPQVLTEQLRTATSLVDSLKTTRDDLPAEHAGWVALRLGNAYEIALALVREIELTAKALEPKGGA
jgi:hypothetical protein